ncbi:MAG: YIP1 family protein [Halobacteria archaeon]|nr:YIP1 family protein [Halobacteria archaeon]
MVYTTGRPDRAPRSVSSSASSSSPDQILTGADAFGVFVFVAGAVLLAAPLLHVVTAFEYLLLWTVTEKDEGVDRTLRAVAYSAAPAVFSWIPFAGIVSVYGVYLLYVGVKEGHGIRGWKAAAVVAVPAVLVFGVGFSGFERGRELGRLGAGLLRTAGFI